MCLLKTVLGPGCRTTYSGRRKGRRRGARAVRKHDCGAYVQSGNAEAAAETLAGWADNPARAEDIGERARTAFEAHYTRSHAVEAYGHLFNEMHTSEGLMSGQRVEEG